MRAELLKGHLDLLLLSVLADEPLHGYAAIEALRRRGGFELPEGTVYPALHRLEAGGMLVSRWSSESGRRRRLYSLTRSGRRELARRHDEWRTFTGAVGAVVS
ncbi:MAG: helix-turn-helix transcriptional regulator [Gaiellaceae bacterium]